MKRIKQLSILLLVLCIMGCQGNWSQFLPASSESVTSSDAVSSFDIDSVPQFTQNSYVEINGNRPFFTEADKTTDVFEVYSELDELGRCGKAYANICMQLMPEQERKGIGHIRPSGWHTVKYDCIPDRYLFNRCHLIGFQLAGENDNEKNLITGTRFLNVEGMLPFENQVAEYVRRTGHHVLYRVTPIYQGQELVARGVLMEGLSVEDDEVSFCIFAYNNQPGIQIDYSTGESTQEESTQLEEAYSSINTNYLLLQPDFF